MKAAELKNKGVKFTLGGREYELKFNMNTFCELEDVYGDINQAFEDLQNMKVKAIRALLYAAIKVDDENATIKSVGDLLSLNDLENLGAVINEALTASMPEKGETMGE